MPLYTYRCDKCEALIEIVRPFRQYKNRTKCGHCGSLAKRHFPSDVTNCNGGLMNAKELKSLEVPLGKDHGVRSPSDVDKKLDAIHAKYPHFGHPGRVD